MTVVGSALDAILHCAQTFPADVPAGLVSSWARAAPIAAAISAPALTRLRAAASSNPRVHRSLRESMLSRSSS